MQIFIISPFPEQVPESEPVLTVNWSRFCKVQWGRKKFFLPKSMWLL